MVNNLQESIHDALIFPLPLLLSKTAQAIAEAQATLDETSMRIQQQLDLFTAEARTLSGDEPSGLARFQVDATWYHIPEIEIELKMSLSLEVRKQNNNDKPVYQLNLLSIPHNTKSRNLFNFEAEGTSCIKARIVSIPPSERST